MTIIIEGPDNSGKSTLAATLAKRLGCPVVHSEKPDSSWGVNQTLLHSYRQLRPQRAILDRVYAISEYIYGNVVRDGSALGEYHKEALMDLYQRPHLIIYCRPQLKTILDNQGRPQMEGVLEKHAKIVEEYDILMSEIAPHTNLTWYDWEEDNLDNLTTQCKNHLRDFDSRWVSAMFMCKFRGQDAPKKKLEGTRLWANRSQK